MGNLNSVSIELKPKNKYKTKDQLKKGIDKFLEFHEDAINLDIEYDKDSKTWSIHGDHNWPPEKEDLRKLGHGTIQGIDEQEGAYEFSF